MIRIGVRPSLVALSAIAPLAMALAACGNWSLSSASGFGNDVPGEYSGADAGAFNPADAAAVTPFGDAGSEPPAAATVGNPLCAYSWAGEHTCVPDDSLQCAGLDGGAMPDLAEDGGDAGADAGTTACHVVKTSNGALSQACTAPGTGGEGDQCQTGADCDPSFECVGTPGECRHYCCDGQSTCADTAKPSFCDIQSVAWGEVDGGADGGATPIRVPVCMPVATCTLFGACPTASQTCTVVENDGTTSCVEPGSVPVGGSCETDHCQANLACLGNAGAQTCYQLCRIGQGDCPSTKTCTSSAQLFQSSNFGLCL